MPRLKGLFAWAHWGQLRCARPPRAAAGRAFASSANASKARSAPLRRIFPVAGKKADTPVEQLRPVRVIGEPSVVYRLQGSGPLTMPKPSTRDGETHGLSWLTRPNRNRARDDTSPRSGACGVAGRARARVSAAVKLKVVLSEFWGVLRGEFISGPVGAALRFAGSGRAGGGGQRARSALLRVPSRAGPR